MHIGVEISGVTPLLVHAFTDEAQLASTNGTRSAAAAGDRGTPKEQAEKHLYKDSAGKACIPSPNLFSAIVDGGRFFKAGKSKVTTMRSSLIPSCMAIAELTMPIRSKEGWAVDTRPVRIPSTGGRVLRHRPIFNDWGLAFTIDLDTAEMHEKLMREIIDATGKKVGLGDFRPACKGPFGRFVVTSWKPA